METIEFDKQPIEKALEDWGAEITGINTLLGCCELLASIPCSAAVSCWQVWPRKPQNWRRLR